MILRRWYNGLRFQIVVLLTIALVPVGAVAIYQTTRVEDQASQRARVALLAMTTRAARAEEQILERATGTIAFFASGAADFATNPARCREELPRFIAANPIYSFIGIVPVSGIVRCSSSDRVVDISEDPGFKEAIASQARSIAINHQAPASGKSVFVLSEPFELNGVFAGFVSLSIPHASLPDVVEGIDGTDLAELLTINRNGDVLTARGGIDGENAELPRNRDLALLHSAGRVAFEDVNMQGEPRTYTVVPIEGSPATVIGVWRTSQSIAGKLDNFIEPAIFPVLMWIASMAVALLSVHTLVLRHIGRIQRNMDAFSKNRSVDSGNQKIAMPYELEALTAHFDRLTDDIMREEARLEDTLREKNVLIKEVHHRVKNNLQLIASIMNMHIRTAKQTETKSVLSRVQDRVLSLATIHRDLYQSHDGGRVNAGELVKEIIQKSLEMAIDADKHTDIETDIDPVMLYPDQAVPLSLLVAEAMTNVMKYLGVQDGKSPRITASLKQEGNHCVLTIENTVGTSDAQESTGLGGQLITAFAIQLHGTPRIEQSEGQYSFSLDFPVEEFEPEVRDF